MVSPSKKSSLDSDAVRQAPTVEGARSHFYPGQVVGPRYEILKRLGRGGMGEVWHAYDLKLRVDVALKSVRRSTSDSIEALRGEVRAAREVVSPNVCRIFDLVAEEGQEFVSMEYIDGQTLLELLRVNSPLELREAGVIALQFLAGLEAIHQAGLVHRDLKPENIMISQTGRVVVMDFGIAEHLADVSTTISGSPPYMSPEQHAGDNVDARSDVFAAGVVLAEMFSAIRDHPSREMMWKSIHENPPKLPDTPWQSVITRAVAINPNDRFASAGALARALEEVRQRVETIEEKKPYPGLSSFSEADAEYFFGRELELEIVLKKLNQMHLMAIIGPSGAGKTSFLRAGLIPELPSAWSCVLMQPGNSPLVNFGQNLATEFSGDPDAIRNMVRLEDVDVAIWLLNRWRQKHSQVVLIVDRFEELFTLCDRETQKNFAELIGRTVLEADVRVLLTMRDDFLIFCNDQPLLSPIFSELTALSPLSGTSLRRALIQPALQCGYRFEDEALIDEILSDVKNERGAMPLMAFAASRLWDKRDRQNGLLTRAAYQEIGGVGGALAQHAEATMNHIGRERHEIVREIFRNLITAQNTRAAHDTDELLSVFENRQSAEEVLGSLVDARLITSFDQPTEGGNKTRRRVELIHESLLSEWPRLVRWQTQDADGVQFRDQFRQAAHVWSVRGSKTELLWSGSSYKEFEVWRERYSGGLTATEKAFADAMSQNIRRQRLRRRIFLAATFVILLSILGIIAGSWRSEKRARQEAVSQMQRADSSKLLALGQAELDQDPTHALAYATASLERADTQVARRFVMQALWRGPPAFIMPDMPVNPSFLSFSPNNKWLGAGGNLGGRLISQDGKKIIVLRNQVKIIFIPVHPQFLPDNDSVVWSSAHEWNTVLIWSISQGKEVRRFQMEAPTFYLIRGPLLILFTDIINAKSAEALIKRDRKLDWKRCRIRSWSLGEKEPKIVGRLDLEGLLDLDVSYDGKQLAYAKGQGVYIRPLNSMENTPTMLVGKHEQTVKKVSFHPNGKELASSDVAGQIRMWSLSNKFKTPIRTIPARGAISNFRGAPGPSFYNSSGTIFAVSYENKALCLWDLNGPSDADPFILRRNVLPREPFITFDQSNRWVAVNYTDSLAFWPINHSYPYALNAKATGTVDGGSLLSFTGDDKKLAVTSFSGDIRLWDLNNLSVAGRNLNNDSRDSTFEMDTDPAGKYLATAGFRGPYVISVLDGKVHKIPDQIGAGAVSFSPDGRFIAAESSQRLIVWDFKSDHVRDLNANKKLRHILRVRYSSDGKLYSGTETGQVYQSNVENGTYKLVAKGNKPVERIVTAKNAPQLVICLWMDTFVDLQKARSELRIIDVRTGKSYPITTHGQRISAVAVDPSGEILVTGDMDGIVRVGPITGEEPHLLFGHQSSIKSVAVDANRRWIASSETERPVVRLWPMPKGKPFHTLPYNELLKRLHALTNVRVVADEKSSTGYRIQFDPFPGWEKVPIW